MNDSKAIDDATASTDEDWTLLDEFRHHCGQGHLDLAKEIYEHIVRETLPPGFESELLDSETYPYTLEHLKGSKACDKNGSSPLHFACVNGHVDIIRWLVATVEIPLFTNAVGNSPLHWAAEAGRTEALRCLCEELNPTGLNVRQLNNFGISPLGFAWLAQCYEGVEMLEQHPTAGECEGDYEFEEEVGC